MCVRSLVPSMNAHTAMTSIAQRIPYRDAVMALEEASQRLPWHPRGDVHQLQPRRKGLQRHEL